MKFTDCIEIVGSKPTLYEGTKQYVSTGAVEEYFINEKSIEEYSYKERPSRADLVGKSGDILFAKMAETKKTLILDKETENYLFSTGFFAIRPKNGILTTKCLYYLLNSKNFLNQKDKNSSGATQKAITNAGLEKINVNIPLFFKQDQIVKQFDLLTDIIKKYQSQLKKLDSLIKSRFIEMFGDIQTYKKEAFKDCSLFIDYRGHTPEVTETGEIRMINAKSVGKGFFKYINEYITKEIYNVWMHRGFPKANDVLFVTEGHTFGNTCQVPSDFKIFALGQRVITIRGNEGKLNNFYLNSYMQTDDFNQDINKYKTGGTAQGIRSKDLIKVEIPIPPYEKQLQFAAFVQQIDKSKFVVQQSLEKAETLYKSLMQEYFG